jgi:hypothetical protein
MTFALESLTARRRFFLLLLAVAALLCAAILFRSWNSDDAARQAAPVRPALSRPIEPAIAESLQWAKARPNPAIQRPGPPDPVAQKRATTSAQKAAQVAAELAGSVASIN